MSSQSPQPLPVNPAASPGRRFWLLMFLSLAAVGTVAYLQYTRVERARFGGEADLPIIAALPDFSLIESDGRPIGRAELRGRVWVADFILTNCAGPCPVMSRRMEELQALLASRGMPDVLCVSISVDPTRDTPQVLREYAQMRRANPKRWLFLTGDENDIFKLAVEGFRVAADKDKGPDEQIIHSTYFVLVDRAGRIRGYYPALADDEETDPSLATPDRRLPADVRDRLLRHIARLRLAKGDE